MERGPLALFGAIIAVGLGPALWIGVQIGPSSQPGPVRPPAAVNEQGAEKAGQLLGGSGAGEESSDSGVDPAPRGNVLPLTTSPKVKTSPSAEPEASTTPPAPEPTPTTTEPTTPADPGTTAPPESTTVPAPDPTDSTDATTPPVDDESDDPTSDPSDNDGSDDDPAPLDGNLISSSNG